jgi:hypothetical protein
MKDGMRLMDASVPIKQDDLQALGELDFASNLGKWPRSNAEASEFVHAFSLIEQAAESAEIPRLDLVWAIWRRVDRLEVARRAISVFAKDLSWVRLAEAASVANRFAATLVLFPELAIDIDPAEVAQRIRNMGTASDSLYFCALSFLVAPRDRTSLELLLLNLAERRSYELLGAFLERSSYSEPNNVFYSRLLKVIIDAAGAREAIETLGSISDRIKGQASLAKQRLGTSVGYGFLSDETQLSELDPLHFADIAMHARQKTALQYRGSQLFPSSSDTRDFFDVFRRAQEKLLPFQAKRSNVISGDEALLVGADQRSGVVSWYDIELSKGPAWIPASSFKTTYAELTPEGTLMADSHPPGGYFQFGPYILLGAGSYNLALCGSASERMSMQLKVSTDYGAKVIKLHDFETGSGLEETISELSFDLNKSSDSVEFSLVVKRGGGPLITNGVILTKRTGSKT